MRDLEEIAHRSCLTCPVCHGVLWKLGGTVALQFRCQVGHSFSTGTLCDLQGQVVEAALWASLRALQEKLRMEQDLCNPLGRHEGPPEEHHHLRVEKLLRDIDELKRILIT